MHEFDKCILTSKSGTTLAQGYVREFEGTVAKIVLDDLCTLTIHQQILIYIFNRVKGECIYSGKIADYEGRKVELDKIHFISSNQKRDNTRVSKTLHYHITERYINSDCKDTEPLEKPIDITVLNISATGMFISCIESFAVGYKFPLTFKDAGKPINLKVEIVRSDKRIRGCNYGCRFVDISRKDADNIFRFVLHEQIVQRRRHLIV